MKRKWLAVGIILLFIGVAVAPSINQSVVTASTDNDLVEVTTQACGIKGYDDTTVKLTKEQYQNLEQYLVDFRARLNQTSTREEAVPIFKDAVVELDRYGLLPKGMSIERAQKLVLRTYLNAKYTGLFEKMLEENQDIKNSNMFCLVFGLATNVKSFGVFYPIRSFLISLCEYLGGEDLGSYIWAISELLLVFRSVFFPLYLFGEFSIGAYQYIPEVGDFYYPSNGLFLSLGMFGFKTYSGSLYGQIRSIPFWVNIIDFYSGILGFTGLNIRTSKGNFLIGSCLLIDMGPSPP
jgi:hypothetical protein